MINYLTKGDLVPALNGTVVKTNVGVGGATLGAPIFVTVTDWTDGKEGTYMLYSEQLVSLEVWE
jgi:hypothetical protein